MTVNRLATACRWVLFGILIVAVVTVGSYPVGAQPVGADSPSSVLPGLVDEALRSNQSLRQEELELARARAALAPVRGQYLPTLDVQARYSRAEGGRTVDLPIGDLVTHETLDADSEEKRVAALAKDVVHE